MKATAVCNGSATIITAFATGRGGAYGIGLENRTTVEINDSGLVVSDVNGQDGVGLGLASAALKRTLEHFSQDFTGAVISTKSNIPLCAGLKSSSVAANAVVLATAGSIAAEHGEIRSIRLNKTESRQELVIDGNVVSEAELLNIGIDAAFDAKVTVTGALDDASASFLGGYTLTDNLKRRVVYHGGMEEGLNVLIYLPEGRIDSASIDPQRLKMFSKDLELLWEQARCGRIYSAITLNGFIHSIAFKLGTEPAMAALEAGAIAAGLSGTGPAVVALARDDGGAIIDAWSKFDGTLIQTKTNNLPARIVK
jgi:shikimate kinase